MNYKVSNKEKKSAHQFFSNQLPKLVSVVLLSLVLLLSSNCVLAQENQIAIGDWRSHLNYSRVFKTVQADDLIYCASTNGLFYIDLKDNSTKSLSTVDGFSSVRPRALAYSGEYNTLIVGYEGGNIDLVTKDRIINVPYIFQSSNISGAKEINDISFFGKNAYLSTSFGIVVYDLVKREIRESYLNLSATGNQLEVINAQVFNNRLYAATSNGLRTCSLNDNLLDFNFWRTEDPNSCSFLEVYKNELIIGYNDGSLARMDTESKKPFVDNETRWIRSMDVYENQLIITKDNDVDIWDEQWNLNTIKTNSPQHCFISDDGSYWISTGQYGVLHLGDEDKFVIPNGPSSHNCWDIATHNGEIWVASGGLDLIYNPTFRNDGFYRFRGNRWDNFTDMNFPVIQPFRDFHIARIDKERNYKYLVSYNMGFVQFNDKNELSIQDKKASGGVLESPNNDTSLTAAVRIAGMDIDTQGNLWMSVQYAENQLVVKTLDDKWYNFNLGLDKRVNQVLVDKIGQKWVVVHLDGIYVYDDGENLQSTSDDMIYRYRTNQGNGNLPAPDVYAITLDREGDVWIGTSNGIAVVYEPEAVFKPNGNSDAQQIYVVEDGVPGYLLEGQKVNCIAVDGANQKWIGTNSGIFVTNPSGDKILHNFTMKNSPLYSNTIRSIGIENVSGEVFIATDRGIISYRAAATEGGETHEGVHAFPNPVRPGYTGTIAIKGLVENANIKITDVSGAIVYETTAQGGQAIWNGRNFNGAEVSSGVYLVFSSDRLGQDTYVTKIMMIK